VAGNPADDAEAGDIPDHELTRVLQEHGQALEEQSRALRATGAASISVDGLLLHARLRLPRRWRKGRLELTLEDPSSGESLDTSSGPLGRTRRSHGPLSLIDQITIRLALQVVARGPS
jgi:hypothetical protein